LKVWFRATLSNSTARGSLKPTTFTTSTASCAAIRISISAGSTRKPFSRKASPARHTYTNELSSCMTPRSPGHIEVRCADPGSGDVAAVGYTGELQFRGSTWSMPTSDRAQQLTPDGRFRCVCLDTKFVRRVFRKSA
jgi:hypothetical protein